MKKEIDEFMGMVQQMVNAIDTSLYPETEEEIEVILNNINNITNMCRNKRNEIVKSKELLKNELNLLKSSNANIESQKKVIFEKIDELSKLGWQIHSFMSDIENQFEQYKNNLSIVQDFLSNRATGITSLSPPISFFADKEIRQEYHGEWKFINPGNSKLNFEDHHFEDFKVVMERTLIPNNNSSYIIDHFQIQQSWRFDKDGYISTMLNQLPRTICADDPRYITIPVSFYTYQKPVIEEEEEEEEETKLYDIDLNTFDYIDRLDNGSCVVSSQGICGSAETFPLTFDLWVTIFSFLDYITYYHQQQAICQFLGFDENESQRFLNIWLQNSRHETLIITNEIKDDDNDEIQYNVMDEETVTKLQDVHYLVNGIIHRENDLPAMLLSDNSVEYRIAGERHRDGDKPARISTNGSEYYYKHGKRHRDNDKPAVILFSKKDEGSKKQKIRACKWYKNGVLHRDHDKPALITWKGLRKFFKNGIVHREGAPASITPHESFYISHGSNHRSGDKPCIHSQEMGLVYYEYGRVHRTNAPAMITKLKETCYIKYNRPHRLNGPAVISKDENLYYINGISSSIRTE